jgi:hypothetical protein
LRKTALTSPSDLPCRKKGEMTEQEILSRRFSRNPSCERGIGSWTTLLESFDNYRWWPRNLQKASHFEGVAHFKVQDNFYIPLFEGHIEEDSLENWLNLLEAYYSIQFVFREKISPPHSLKPFPMSDLGGKVTGRGTS